MSSEVRRQSLQVTPSAGTGWYFLLLLPFPSLLYEMYTVEQPLKTDPQLKNDEKPARWHMPVILALSKTEASGSM